MVLFGEAHLRRILRGYAAYYNARVLSEDYDTTGRIIKVRGLPDAIARLRTTLAAS